ncbi:MAG TPA: M36 family metallopeptidase [Verrucomicrobiae bacterium]
MNTNASPNGWIDDLVNETRGNNVDAHADRNDNDQPDLPRPTGNPFRVFDFPLDLTQAPTTYSNAAIVNLFYWNNFVHDKLYDLGFTEAAGNFQNTNFGRGGLGNDAVQADAQDGGGFNNANMATPPDGFPPRMQMYIFDQPSPNRDGDLDAEVMIHEYMHGLSNRRVGGGIGIFELQTGGMGEGWGDFYGLTFLSETSDVLNGVWAAGGYLTFDITGNGTFRDNYYFGIRRYPYTTNLLKNPLTFKDIDPAQASPHAGIPRNPIFGGFTPFDADEVHNQGEVWSVTLWEMRVNLIAKYGHAIGTQVALQLVTDAMSLCPPNPNFLQSRDAILQADLVNNNNANYNEIWRAFAKRGMGGTATSPDSSTTAGVKESFDFPGISIVSAMADDSLIGNGNGAIDNNECVEIFITLRNNSVFDETNIITVLSSTNAGVTVSQPSSAYPNLVPTETAQNLMPFRVTTAPGFVCGTPIEFALAISSISNTQEVRTNFFRLRTGFVSLNPTLLNNSSPANIPDANTNGVDSIINVSGMSGVLGKVAVSLYIKHPFDNDLVLELIGPDGTAVALAKNQGGPFANYGVSCSPFSARTTFDDNAPVPISLGNAPFVGSFRPDEPLVIFAGKTGAALNGAWRLRVTDGISGNIGTLQCWTLSLFPTVCTDGGGPCTADVIVSGTAAPAPALLGQNLTYTIFVTNTRPISAASVAFTNVLPANVSYVSAASTQGACTFSNGMVRCDFGTLDSASNAVVTIVVQPTALGSVTNVFSVGSPTLDANPANNVATIISVVSQAAAQLVADRVQLVGDATGGIEAGETVTVNFALRNIGSAATTNLVATLLEGTGISAASAPQNYGAIAVGTNASRPFTFTAAGNVGDSISAVLQLQDGIQNLGTATFHFTLGGEVTFVNGAAITINQLGTATPYPSTISVSGVTGVISKVRVTFTKLSHTYPDDIDALVAGPLGQKLILMSDAGGSTAIVNKTLTFDGAAGAALPNEAVINAGSFLPNNYDSGTEPGGDVFPAPAPVGALASSFLAFNSTNPNGTWSLFVHDDGGNDAGSISGGWGLAITVVVPVNPLANLSLAASAAPNPAVVGEPLTYTLTVANLGPSNAPSVAVNDTIPAGSSFVEAIPSQGSVSFAAGVVSANLGTISNGASATVTVTVTPTSSGFKTNSATVSAISGDLDPSNNTATTVLVANNPVADLTVSVTSAPEPLFVSSNVTFTAIVTNRGPNHADSVRITNRLSSSLAFVSATNTQGSCSFSNGIITCDLGSLPASGSATAVIIATALSSGSVTNLFAVISSTTDPIPANNSTNVIGTVNSLAPLVISAGVALVSESAVPANGAIESGELVTVNFGLRNAGTADAGNVVATLQGTGGILAPSSPQTYGSMLANGSTVSKPFSFIANSPAGSTLTATLLLDDGGQNLGTVSFTFTLSASRGFTNGSVIIIPDNGPATNYPSTITVASTGTVSKVTVTIKQLAHTFPEDIDMLLVSPAGQKIKLMSDAGAGNSVTNVTLTFDDSASGLPFSTAITSGTYHATDFPPGDSFPAPAPAGPYGTNLSVLNAVNPNGAWSLYVFDDANGDQGRINGGWTLDIQTASPVASSADVAVNATAPATIPPGATFTNVITVANYGPATATGVVLTDTLPNGFALGAVTVSQGGFSTVAGSVTANLGTLVAGATATITISGSGSVNMTNALSVSAAQADANLANNSTTLVTLVVAPSLSIRHVGANIVISWPAPSTGYVLESSTSVLGPWAAVGAGITVVNGENQVTVPATGTAFYRLRKP